MKKQLSMLIFIFISLSTNAQFANWDVCYDTLKKKYIPTQDSLVALVCWNIEVINNLNCDLDFFADYSCHPCGDILALAGPAPDGNLVRAGYSRNFKAYKINWKCGGDTSQIKCVCPCKLKFRIGAPNIAPLDPFAIEPWPISSAWSTLSPPTITYSTSLTCTSGIPPNPQMINIYFQINSNKVTITFY